MDRLVVVKFHLNIANRWLSTIQIKMMVIILNSSIIHKVILTCLGVGRFSGHGVKMNHQTVAAAARDTLPVRNAHIMDQMWQRATKFN